MLPKNIINEEIWLWFKNGIPMPKTIEILNGHLICVVTINVLLVRLVKNECRIGLE